MNPWTVIGWMVLIGITVIPVILVVAAIIDHNRANQWRRRWK